MIVNQIEPFDLLEQTLSHCFEAEATLWVCEVCALVCVCANST